MSKVDIKERIADAAEKAALTKDEIKKALADNNDAIREELYLKIKEKIEYQTVYLELSDKNEITEEEKTSLLLSINGLAAGLRNTG